MESNLNSTGIFLAVSSALNPKAFCGYIISVLLLGVSVGFFFKDIIKKWTGYPFKGISKDLNVR